MADHNFAEPDEERDIWRVALEVIAVGDADNEARKIAEDALIESGFWHSRAPTPRAGCMLSALRQCHCIGRAAGPNCRFWSADIDGEIKRSAERNASMTAAPQAPSGQVKLFKTTVLGVGPYCIEFPDGEIIHTRSETRQLAIAAALAGKQSEREAFIAESLSKGATLENATIVAIALAGQQSERPAPAGQAVGELPTWVNCETRGPWVRNGLKARIEELRKSEKRVRAAYTKPFMSEPCAFIADAYAEAAAALENRLALAASQAERPAVKEE